MPSMDDIVTDPGAWNAVANGYQETTRLMLTPFSEEAIRWAALGDTDEVLDVACGPGTTTVLAARLARSVQAVDFAEDMVALLNENAADLDNVHVQVGDGQSLTFEDNRFSAAFSMFGLMFFPDPIAGLRELHRVLRPGGQAFISSWVPRDRSPAMQPLGAALMHAIPPQPDQDPPKPFAFNSAESLEAGFREAGFEDVEVRQVSPQVPVESPEGYWATTRGNLYVTRMREQAGEAWPEIEARVLEHLRQSLADVKSLALPAFLGRGVKR